MYNQMVFIHDNWLRELRPTLPSMENSPIDETITLPKEAETPSDSAKAIICVNTTAEPKRNMNVVNISKIKCTLENIMCVMEVTLWLIKVALLSSLLFFTSLFRSNLSGISSLVSRKILLCFSGLGFISSIAATQMWSSNPLLIIKAPEKKEDEASA